MSGREGGGFRHTRHKSLDATNNRQEVGTHTTKVRRLIGEGHQQQEFRIQFSVSLDFKRQSDVSRLGKDRSDVKSSQGYLGIRSSTPNSRQHYDASELVMKVEAPKVFMIQHIVQLGKKRKRQREAALAGSQQDTDEQGWRGNISPGTTMCRWSETGAEVVSSPDPQKISGGSSPHAQSVRGSRMVTSMHERPPSPKTVKRMSPSISLKTVEPIAEVVEPPKDSKPSPPKIIINIMPPAEKEEPESPTTETYFPTTSEEPNVVIRPRINLGLTRLVNSEIFEVPEEDSESTYKQGPSPSKRSSSKFREVVQTIEEDFQSKTLSKDRSNASRIASESEELDTSRVMAREAKKAISKFILQGKPPEKTKPISILSSHAPEPANGSLKLLKSEMLQDTVSLPDQNNPQIVVRPFKKKGTEDIVRVCEMTPELGFSPQSGLIPGAAYSLGESSQQSLEKYTHVTTQSRQVPSRFKPKMGGGGSVDVGLYSEQDARYNPKALSSYRKKTVTSKEREYSETSMISYLEHKKSLNDLPNSSKSELKRSNTGLSQVRPQVTLAAVSDLQPNTQPGGDFEGNLIEPQENSAKTGQMSSVKVSGSQKFHKSKTIGSPGKSSRHNKSNQNVNYDDYVSKAGLDRSKGFITKKNRIVTEDSINSSKLSSQHGRTDRNTQEAGVPSVGKPGNAEDGQESLPYPVVIKEAESHHELLTKSRVSQGSSLTGKKGDGENLLSGEFGYNSHSGPMFLSPYSVFPNKFALATAKAFGIRRGSFALNPVPVDMMQNYQNRSIEGRKLLDGSVAGSNYNESRDEAFMKSSLSRYMEESRMSRGNINSNAAQELSRKNTPASMAQSNILNSMILDQISRRNSICIHQEAMPDQLPKRTDSISIQHEFLGDPTPKRADSLVSQGKIERGPMVISRSSPRAVTLAPSLSYLPVVVVGEPDIKPPQRQKELMVVVDTTPKRAGIPKEQGLSQSQPPPMVNNGSSPSSTRAVKASSPTNRQTLVCGAIYEGPSVGGTPHGKGVMKFPQGDLYSGEFVSGTRQGRGKMYFVDGSVYEGTFEENRMSGQGQRQFPNGERYIGGFLNNAFHGEGEFCFRDGRTYVGSWAEGRMHGKGTIRRDGVILCDGVFEGGQLHGTAMVVQRDGSMHEGGYVRGCKEGPGVIKDREGGIIYEGQFAGDRFHGKGKLKMEGGAFYEGDFAKGEFEGLGKLMLSGGGLILGHFSKGMVNGKAVEVLPSGNKYKGEYKNGLREGLGIFEWSKGGIYLGQFSQGKKHGKGMIIFPDKGCQSGEFKDGNFKVSEDPENDGMAGLPTHFLKEFPRWAKIIIPEQASDLDFSALDMILGFISQPMHATKSLARLVDDSTPSIATQEFSGTPRIMLPNDSTRVLVYLKNQHQSTSALHIPTYDSFCHSIEGTDPS